MTCTNCAATIEKGLAETEGMDSANVNFASEKATVEYDPNKVDLSKIKDTIAELGYGIATKKSIYPVGGMTCAACVTRVEEALKTRPVSSPWRLIWRQRGRRWRFWKARRTPT